MIRVINIQAAPATPTAEGSVRTVLSQASDGTRVEVAVNEIDPGRSLHLEPGPRTRVAYLLEGKDADARSDLWALGCVLYEMATGKRAFEGKSQASLISAIMSSEPPRMSQLAPLTPASLDRLVRSLDCECGVHAPLLS